MYHLISVYMYLMMVPASIVSGTTARRFIAECVHLRDFGKSVRNPRIPIDSTFEDKVQGSTIFPPESRAEKGLNRDPHTGYFGLFPCKIQSSRNIGVGPRGPKKYEV